jgi:putative addiction module component
MNTVEKLKKQIAALSEQGRNEITFYLMELQGYEWVPGEDPEWEAELNRRCAEVESGKDPGKPGEQVMAEIREKLACGRIASSNGQKKNYGKRRSTLRRKRV